MFHLTLVPQGTSILQVLQLFRYVRRPGIQFELPARLTYRNRGVHVISCDIPTNNSFTAHAPCPLFTLCQHYHHAFNKERFFTMEDGWVWPAASRHLPCFLAGIYIR